MDWMQVLSGYVLVWALISVLSMLTLAAVNTSLNVETPGQKRTRAQVSTWILVVAGLGPIGMVILGLTAVYRISQGRPIVEIE